MFKDPYHTAERYQTLAINQLNIVNLYNLKLCQ